jgi:hypothetical protein
MNVHKNPCIESHWQTDRNEEANIPSSQSFWERAERIIFLGKHVVVLLLTSMYRSLQISDRLLLWNLQIDF